MSSNGDVEAAPALLDLDIDAIEDKEFGLPHIQKTSVKKSPIDNESVISEDEGPHFPSELLNPPGFEETASVSSTGSHGPFGTAQQSKASTKPEPGILDVKKHKTISTHIEHAGEGECTAIAVNTLLVVGTAAGTVLCYDPTCMPRWTHRQSDEGPVTALDINPDSSRVLAGYALGVVVMLDAADAKLLRLISPESHALSTAVLHVKFTDIPSLALLSDSGGSLFEISLKRVLGVRTWDTRVIFSGSHGEVVAVQPLLLNNFDFHPLAGSVIVAVATLKRVILIHLRPGTKVMFSQTIQGPPTSLPLLAWQFTVIKSASGAPIFDPVLAVARHDTIFFYEVGVERSGRVSCYFLRAVDLGFSAMTCHWLSPHAVALLDTDHTLHLIDVRHQECLETLDLSSVGLVYSTVAFQGVYTGGNVSKAMALAGTKACYNSVVSVRDGYIYFLGSKSIRSVCILPWSKRINNLIRANRFEDSLKLAMSFYDGRGKAVLGLKGPRETRRKLVKEKIIDVLSKFIDLILAEDPEINLDEAIPLVIEYSLDLDQSDLVFDKLWNGLNDGREVFLDSMESAILEGKVSVLPPEIMQRLAAYQQSNQSWSALEDCILRVEISCLDIEQVIRICRKERLYSALISIWNRAMNDYTSPITELFPILKSCISEDGSISEEGRKLGNLLLVYIASCLSGHLGEEKGERMQVVRALTSQHSPAAPDEELPFPYIRTLLEFDSREFLNALVIAFSDTGLLMTVKQRLVDIILQIMTDDSRFKCTEIAWVVTAMRTSAVGRQLRTDPSLYTDTVSRLVTEEEVPASERQAALLQLLTSGALSCLEHDTLLQFATSASFFQVCSVLHEMRGEYKEVLKAQLSDPLRRQHIFSFIEQSPHKHDMGVLEPDNLQQLLEIDAMKTSQLLYRHMPGSISHIIPKLSDDQLYLFLQGIIEEGEVDTEYITRYVCLMCRYEPSKVLEVVKSHENIELDPAIKVCQERGLDEVTAVLLERSGDIQGAFNVLLSRLQSAIEKGENGTERMTQELVNLAQRGSTVLDSKTSWFPLLMCLLKLNSTELLQRVLNTADLNLVSELHLLMQHSQGTLGELRALIMGLFVKCRHQKRMLEATTRLHMSGLHGDLAVTFAEAKVGCRSPSSCYLCRGPFSSSLYLFRCGHGYHEECILPKTKCVECFKE